MRSHITTLGWLHVALGVLTMLSGLVFLLFFSGLGTAVAAAGGKEAFPVAAIFGGVGTFIFLMIAIFAVPGILLGWGLLNFKPWARILGIIFSLLSLLHPSFGLGTILAVYGLYVFFQPETVALFEGNARPYA